MKASLIQMPGYALHEYQVVINPHESLRERILRKRTECRDRFGFPDVPAATCLTLARFKQRVLSEERTIAQLAHLAMGGSPFRVSLRGFTGLPDHSLFFRVERSTALRQLTGDLKSLQRHLQPDADHKPQFFPEPNIPLATRLKPGQYQQAWAEYAHRHFTADFIADGLLVLRRTPADTRFQVMARLEFRNLPVVTRQGELFA
jgi:hypothetical protein